MFVCYCPNCGREISVPWWLPRTVTCKECHTKSIVPYGQDPNYGNYSAIAKVKVKSNDFRTARPNLVKGAAIASIAAIAGVVWFSTKDDSTNVLPATEPSEEPIKEQNHPLSIASDADMNNSLSESFSEPEESTSDHREYSPRNPDNYDIVTKSIGLTMVHLHEGWRPSQEKIDAFKEQTGNDLPQDMTFRNPHEQGYQVKKN